MCTAPVMTSCAGGTCPVRKTFPAGVSAMPLLPRRMCFSMSSLSGSRATSAALTRRCSPVVTSVTTTAGRRAARSALSALRISSFMPIPAARSVRPLPPCGGGLGVAAGTGPRRAGRPPPQGERRTECVAPACAFLPLLHFLHIDPDGAAAGEPDLPGGFVGYPEFQRLRLAALDDVERLGDDRALHAATRDAAE